MWENVKSIEENTALMPIFLATTCTEDDVKNLGDLLGERAWSFVKRYGILILALVFLAAWTLATCTITVYNTRSATEKRLTGEYAEQLAAYAEEWERSHAASLSEQMQAEIEADAAILEHIGMGVLSTYEKARLTDAGTQMQIALNRVLAGGEFANVKSVSDAAAVPGAWTGYDPGGSVTEDVHALAMRMAAAYHKGEPMPCSSRYLWTEWSDGEMVARDKYMIDSSCHFWRMSET